MWGGPLWMLVWPAILVAFIVTMVHWLSGKGGGGDRPPRSARDILDQRYARGEFDREKYVKRKQNIAKS